MNGWNEETEILIEEILTHAYENLPFDAAFLVEYKNSYAEVIGIVGIDFSDIFHVGFRCPLESTYSYKMLKTRVPSLIKDTHASDETRHNPLTDWLDIRSFAAAHIVLKSGVVFGALCCLSQTENKESDHRDITLLRVMANMLAAHLDRQSDEQNRKMEMYSQIFEIIEDKNLQIVFQPIMDLRTDKIVGYEALSRFPQMPVRSPDAWFADAKNVGLGVALEVMAFDMAFSMLEKIDSGCYLSINISPDTLISTQFVDYIQGLDNGIDRLIMEITEHASIDNYMPLMDSMAVLRDLSIRVAVDDVGAGYAGLRHIIQINPAIIKLDMSLTRDIHIDRSKQAMVSALSVFAGRMGIKIVSEGIEKREEMDVLKVLGIDYGQGYFIGKPSAALLEDDQAQSVGYAPVLQLSNLEGDARDT